MKGAREREPLMALGMGERVRGEENICFGFDRNTTPSHHLVLGHVTGSFLTFHSLVAVDVRVLDVG